MDELAGNAGHTVRLVLEDLKPDMVLAEDLRHINGRLILKRGITLCQRHFRVLKMWGVTDALVESAGEELSSPVHVSEPEDLAAVEKQVMARFQLCNLSHEVCYSLFRQAVRSRRIRLEGELPPLELDEDAEWAQFPGFDVFEKKMEADFQLSSLPALVTRLNEALEDPRCSSTHVAEIISKDAGLTARLLRFVNSAFFNFPKAIESVPHAVTIVGSRQLSHLAMAAAVMATFKDIPNEVVDMESFLTHSIACGLIARILASYFRGSHAERYFLGGLLHDVGRLIMCQHCPDQSRLLFRKARQMPCLVYKLEEVMGTDHQRLGAMLISKWRLPREFEGGCGFHHHPLESSDPLFASILHVSDLMAHAFCLGSSGEFMVPPLDVEAWQTLGLPSSVITSTIQQAWPMVQDTVQSFLSHD